MSRGGCREGAGRKPIGDGKRKDLKIYLDPADDEWVRAEASKRQLSLSAIIAICIAVKRKHAEEWPE
jgi:hypothetical protein